VSRRSLRSTNSTNGLLIGPIPVFLEAARDPSELKRQSSRSRRQGWSLGAFFLDWIHPLKVFSRDAPLQHRRCSFASSRAPSPRSPTSQMPFRPRVRSFAFADRGTLRLNERLRGLVRKARTRVSRGWLLPESVKQKQAVHTSSRQVHLRRSDGQRRPLRVGPLSPPCIRESEASALT
jgi:hypothetical protein